MTGGQWTHRDARASLEPDTSFLLAWVVCISVLPTPQNSAGRDSEKGIWWWGGDAGRLNDS
jgi:hypothetical protein